MRARERKRNSQLMRPTPNRELGELAERLAGRLQRRWELGEAEELELVVLHRAILMTTPWAMGLPSSPATSFSFRMLRRIRVSSSSM